MHAAGSRLYTTDRGEAIVRRIDDPATVLHELPRPAAIHGAELDRDDRPGDRLSGHEESAAQVGPPDAANAQMRMPLDYPDSLSGLATVAFEGLRAVYEARAISQLVLITEDLPLSSVLHQPHPFEAISATVLHHNETASEVRQSGLRP